jgi:hypothetical protein
MAWQPVPDDLQVGAVTEWGAEGLLEIVVVLVLPDVRGYQSRFRYQVPDQLRRIMRMAWC